MGKLLEVEDLRVEFRTEAGIVRAINGVSFDLAEGERLGIVGESGCGKTVLALSILRLIPPPGQVVGGRVIFRGEDLLGPADDEVRKIRGRQIAMVFQDPMTSLNPVLTIGRQITEALEVHLGLDTRTAQRRAIELLEMVEMPAARQRADEYPHQLSGGMRQRAMIAIALSCNPKLLIADEPTTALDVTIQAGILDLIEKISDECGMAVILITHDFGVVAGTTQKVAVLYAGHIVEMAPTVELFERPRHPYTLGLMRAMPRLDEEPERLTPIEGSPPDPVHLPPGCPFAPRCRYAVAKSEEVMPPLEPVGRPDHLVACWVDVTTGRERSGR